MAKETGSAELRWLAFVANLPTEDPAARMRVLRTLESLGCAVLREGVYLLPDSEQNRRGLQRLAEYVARIDGSSFLLWASGLDPAQSESLRALFDRSRKYEELIKTVAGLRSAFGVSDPAAIAQVLGKQRREFEAISALDFFPSPARERAERLLEEMEAEVRGLLFPQEATAERSEPPRRRYLNRIWATCKPLWADRLACAWLIRRFIDPEARFLWLEKGEPCPPEAVGFAFDGASFRNSTVRVTFEELLQRFGLHGNATLVRIGALVRSLESGGPVIAEAAGVDTLLQGARRRCVSEDELLIESEKTFDLLYETYFETPRSAPPR